MKKGMKFDDMKLDYSLLPIEAIEEEIKVLMVGASKYEANNWQKVENGVIRYINASYRHLGEIVKLLNNDKSLDDISKLEDSDDGLHPLAHCACDIHFALSLLKKYNNFNNNKWKDKIKTIKEDYKEEREKFKNETN